MNIVTLAGAAFALALSALGGPSLSPVLFAPESRSSDLAGAACRSDLPDHLTGEAGLRICPGLGGARLVLSQDGPKSRLGLEWSSRERADDVAGEPLQAGTVEWRGMWTGRVFEPYGLIVPVELEGARTLAVIRIRRGEACLVGKVEASADDAVALSRRLADELARGTASCPQIRPALVRPARTEGLV